MEPRIREMIDWEQPFPPEEFADRRRRVKAALEQAGLDGMLMTAPRDFYYLTGHDQIWQYRYGLTGLFFNTELGEFFFFDNASHVAVVSTTPEIHDVIYHPRGKSEEQADFVAAEIVRRGWARGRIAIQTWSYGAHPDLVRRVGARLSEGGAEVVEDSTTIEDVRLYKSPREMEVMRAAGEATVQVMHKVQEFLRPGIMETDIDAVICYELMARGCGHPGIRNMIGSGARSGNHHGPATHRTLKQGDVLHVDFSACLHRYHVNLSRSFAIGEIDPRWHDLMDRSAGCTEAIVSGVKCGDPFSAVQDAADAFIASSGVDRARYEWFIGGYVLGIAFPPDWVHRHRPRPFEDEPDPEMRPGMVFNFEVQYDVFDGWHGGSGAGWIDSYMMTEQGLEVLTEFPRELTVVNA